MQSDIQFNPWLCFFKSALCLFVSAHVGYSVNDKYILRCPSLSFGMLLALDIMIFFFLLVTINFPSSSILIDLCYYFSLANLLFKMFGFKRIHSK